VTPTPTEVKEYGLSYAGWVYESDRDTETAGWRDPLAYGSLYDVDAAFRLQTARGWPVDLAARAERFFNT
jgi:hypothetical protein